VDADGSQDGARSEEADEAVYASAAVREPRRMPLGSDDDLDVPDFLK
jgi:hypothetical protein